MTKETALSQMQQELLNRADAIFEKVSQAASKAYDVAAEQLPDIAYQFIAYNRLYLTFVVCLTVLIAIILYTATIVFGVKEHRQQYIEYKKRTDYSGYALMLALISILYSLFILLPVMLQYLQPFFMVWVAPKIFLIMEIKNLVSGK